MVLVSPCFPPAYPTPTSSLCAMHVHTAHASYIMSWHSSLLIYYFACVDVLLPFCRFHHIKSLTKRKHILEWGKELRLGGYSKPGYPGGLPLHIQTIDSNPSHYLLMFTCTFLLHGCMTCVACHEHLSAQNGAYSILHSLLHTFSGPAYSAYL